MCRRVLSAFLIVALVATTVVLAGCRRDAAVGRETVAEAVRIRVSGSGTAMPAFRLLAEEFGSDTIEFEYLPGLHSGGGIEGVASGDLEIGVVSRDLTAEEETLGLEYVKLSDDGLAVAVNSSVTINGLTAQQVRDIYSGVYTNWKELGGPDLGIVILDRAEDESAKMILRQYLLGPGLKVSPSAVSLSYEPDLVAALRQTEGAIGYFSLGLGLSEAVPVRLLEIDGVAPTLSTIASREYEMVRPLGIVVASPASPELSVFLSRVRSSEATDFLAGKGFAPPVKP